MKNVRSFLSSIYDEANRICDGAAAKADDMTLLAMLAAMEYERNEALRLGQEIARLEQML